MSDQSEKNKKKPTTIVYKFPKRRFDGGGEIELIESIERRKQQAASMQNQSVQPVRMPASQPVNLVNQVDKQTPGGTFAEKKDQSRLLRVRNAFLMGPVQMCVGVVGILTTGIALYIFKRADNPGLLAQTKSVLRDCRDTLVKGFVHTLISPGEALKIALLG